MVIERHFGYGYYAKADSFEKKCREIPGLFVQRYRIRSSAVAIRVSGEALTGNLAESLLEGHKNCVRK